MLMLLFRRIAIERRGAKGANVKTNERLVFFPFFCSFFVRSRGLCPSPFSAPAPQWPLPFNLHLQISLLATNSQTWSCGNSFLVGWSSLLCPAGLTHWWGGIWLMGWFVWWREPAIWLFRGRRTSGEELSNFSLHRVLANRPLWVMADVMWGLGDRVWA
jgi:hypothetical protein